MDKPIPDNTPNQIRGRFNKVAVFVIALILTTAIILQGNFLEGLLKLLGVGASRLQTISVTSVDDWFGRSGEWRADFEGDGYNFPTFQDTAAFSFFSNQPVDPGEEAGVIMPLWTGGADLLEIVSKVSTYTSPVVDMGLSEDFLHSIDVLDYQPASSEIIYEYHMADSLVQLNKTNYKVLEPRSNGKQSEFTLKQALLGVPLHRYLQFQVSFRDFYPNDRPMVAEFNINYGPEGEMQITNEVDSMLPNLPEEISLLGDFNGDGVINSIDHALFIKLWSEFQYEGSFDITD